nr:hypothetical protein [Tanacetum cinerariifolium]
MNSLHESSSPVYMDVMEKEDPFARKQIQNSGSVTSQSTSANEFSTVIGEDTAFHHPRHTSCMTNIVSTEARELHCHSPEQVQLNKRNSHFTLGGKQNAFAERKNLINNHVTQCNTSVIMPNVHCQKKMQLEEGCNKTNYGQQQQVEADGKQICTLQNDSAERLDDNNAQATSQVTAVPCVDRCDKPHAKRMHRQTSDEIQRNSRPDISVIDTDGMEKDTDSECIQKAICNSVFVNYANAMDMQKSPFNMENGSPDANTTTDEHTSYVPLILLLWKVDIRSVMNVIITPKGRLVPIAIRKEIGKEIGCLEIERTPGPAYYINVTPLDINNCTTQNTIDGVTVPSRRTEQQHCNLACVDRNTRVQHLPSQTYDIDASRSTVINITKLLCRYKQFIDPFPPEAHTFIQDCNEFGKGAKPGVHGFTLDKVFTQKPLSLKPPTADSTSTSSTLQDIKHNTPTTTTKTGVDISTPPMEIQLRQTHKDITNIPNTKKSAKRELYKEIKGNEDKASSKKPHHEREKEASTHDWGRMSHHDTCIRVEKGVPTGQQKTQAEGEKTPGSSFKATSRAPVNVSKKSKKNGMPLTAQVAGRALGTKNCTTQKMITLRADTGSPRSIGQTMKMPCRDTSPVVSPVKYYILLPLWTVDLPFSQDPKSSHNYGSKPSSNDEKKVDEDSSKESECNDQEKKDNVNGTNNVNTVSSFVKDAGTNEVNAVGGKTSTELPFDPNMTALEGVSIFNFSRDDEDDDVVLDMKILDTTIQVSPIPTTRIHKDHPLD